MIKKTKKKIFVKRRYNTRKYIKLGGGKAKKSAKKDAKAAAKADKAAAKADKEAAKADKAAAKKAAKAVKKKKGNNGEGEGTEGENGDNEGNKKKKEKRSKGDKGDKSSGSGKGQGSNSGKQNKAEKKAEKKRQNLETQIKNQQKKTQKILVKFTKALQGKESFNRYPEGLKKDIISSAQGLCTKPGEKGYPLLDITPKKKKDKLEKNIEKKTKSKGNEELGDKFRKIKIEEPKKREVIKFCGTHLGVLGGYEGPLFYLINLFNGKNSKKKKKPNDKKTILRNAKGKLYQELILKNYDKLKQSSSPKDLEFKSELENIIKSIGITKNKGWETKLKDIIEKESSKKITAGEPPYIIRALDGNPKFPKVKVPKEKGKEKGKGEKTPSKGKTDKPASKSPPPPP